MPIQLKISPRLIPNIAGLYNDSHRMYMEFIDNSIDSAEEYFDANTNSYKKEILITFILSGDNILIEDNCHGIQNLENVVQSIGNSEKKQGQFTNGQFGFGIYAFMSACQSMEIISKYKGQSNANSIQINRKQFETDNIEDVQFPDLQPCNFKHDSGTKVILSAFDDKKIRKNTDFEKIKDEVELHFERLLSRKNFKVLLVNKNEGKEYLCKPFDYSLYGGEEYHDTLNRVSFVKGRVQKQTITYKIPKPISIYLLITKDKYINKAPIFVLKGRRISQIKDLKQFRSKHKSDIWGHPNITGFVDLGDFLEPTIARTDFQNSDKAKAVFNSLIEAESLILDEIKRINKESETDHYQKLQDTLNKALSKLAKVDALNYRTEIIPGNEVNVEGDGGQSIIDQGGQDYSNDGKGSGGNGFGENDGEGYGPSGEAGEDTSNGQNDGNNPPGQESENPWEDSDYKGEKKRKSGFDIQFVEGPPVRDEATDKPLRSLLIDGTIRIFREHEDFEKRLKYSRNNQPLISPRLINYLANEITIHYKDKIQIKHGQPEYNKSMFQDLVDFINLFEEQIQTLTNKNLSDLTA